MLIIGIIILIVGSAVYFFMKSSRFGALPSGENLNKIKQSPSFRNGQFHNLNNTPQLTEGANIFSIMKEFFFDKRTQKIPPAPLPSVKTDLFQLDKYKNVLVWFGHSSYFMQVDGRKILVDPVFSGNASPLRFTTKSFEGSDIYTVTDIPEIDYLFLTHDHWDHLDYRTILQLKSQVKKIITGLGVSAHLKSWGYDQDIIKEMDWNERFIPEAGFSVTNVPARHFSGRGFKRNKSIWSSFVFETPAKNIFIGGDSGYDVHFLEIGNRYGPFDLAILENGQYDRNWKYIHMTPEETVQAGVDLQARKLLPVHWAKFSLSVHSWNEPILRIMKEAIERKIKILHPMIGESVDMDREQTFTTWWEMIP